MKAKPSWQVTERATTFLNLRAERKLSVNNCGFIPPAAARELSGTIPTLSPDTRARGAVGSPAQPAGDENPRGTCQKGTSTAGSCTRALEEPLPRNGLNLELSPVFGGTHQDVDVLLLVQQRPHLLDVAVEDGLDQRRLRREGEAKSRRWGRHQSGVTARQSLRHRRVAGTPLQEPARATSSFLVSVQGSAGTRHRLSSHRWRFSWRTDHGDIGKASPWVQRAWQSPT